MVTRDHTDKYDAPNTILQEAYSPMNIDPLHIALNENGIMRGNLRIRTAKKLKNLS